MATVVFTDPGRFMEARFPKVSDFEDEQLLPGSEISSDYGFEDIVGNSEIGDIGLELQPKLLRAVQEQEFERLGSTRTIQVDVRMIAYTKCRSDLEFTSRW